MGTMLAGPMSLLAGAVAAADTGALPARRYLPAQVGSDVIDVEITLTGAGSSCSIAPAYLRGNDFTVAPAVAIGDKKDIAGPGVWAYQFPARGGSWNAIVVTAVAGGGSIAIRAGYGQSLPR